MYTANTSAGFLGRLGSLIAFLSFESPVLRISISFPESEVKN
jgi:hypothetical protein